MTSLSNSMNRAFAAELRKNRPATETELQLTVRDERERWEWSTRSYDRFGYEHELKNYSQRISGGDYHFFDADTKRFFSSRIGACLHGESPANWNLFITSERGSHQRARLYTVRQLQIDGRVQTIGEFQAYGSSAAAKRAALAYIQQAETQPSA